ncbi:MAG: uroporphyrinogen-III synthase [Pyrinomonadaceae bacterium]
MRSVLLSHSEADGELAIYLEKSAVRVWASPVLAIADPPDNSQLIETINNLFGYDWLILKNERAADYFLRSFLKDHQPEELAELRVLTLGAEAVEKAAHFRVHVDITLDRFANAKIFSEIESYCHNRKSLARLNFLVPSASVSREHFEQQLEDAGARTDAVRAYQTCSADSRLVRLKTLLAGGGIDCIVFTRPAAISESAELLDTDDLPRLFSGLTIACRDEATHAVAIEFGLSQSSVPHDPSPAALVNLINAPGKRVA